MKKRITCFIIITLNHVKSGPHRVASKYVVMKVTQLVVIVLVVKIEHEKVLQGSYAITLTQKGFTNLVLISQTLRLQCGEVGITWYDATGVKKLHHFLTLSDVVVTEKILCGFAV